MSNSRNTGFLTNVIKVDASGNVSFVSGSTTLATINTSGQMSGSAPALSSSYASNADLLDGLDSTVFTLTSSFNTLSSSLSTTSGSFNTRVSALEATGSALSSSILSVSASSYLTSGSLSSASGSFDSRVATIESKYATTGSNTFRAPQYVSDTTVPSGFANSTGSIYTDGGLLVAKDSYFSSSMFIKGNLTIYGTQSIAYITSSQLNIATNLITVNTATPAVRFGGLAVYDSGSTGTGMTGSLLWDSQNNSWIYNNPSGSGNYDSAMVIMGPRNASALGSEQGLTCNYLVQGHGHHHVTSSQIYHDSSTTCFYGGTSFISSNGDVCFSNVGYVGNTLGVGITPKVGDGKLQLALGTAFTFGNSNSVGADYSWISDGSYNFSSGNAFVMATEKSRPIVLATSGSARMCVGSTGITTFTCQTCAPAFYASTTSGRAFGNDNYTTNFGWISMYGTTQGIQLGFEGSTGGQLITGAGANYGILVGKTGLAISANNGGNNHLNITSTGIVTFACQVCVPNLISSGSSGGRYATFGAPTNGGYMTFEANGTPFGDLGSYCAQYGICDATTLLLSSRTGYSLALGSSSTERLRFYSTGIACFACQVCAPYLSVGDGTQAVQADAPITIRRGNGFAGLDFKSARTSGNIGGLRFYDCSDTLQAQQLIEIDGSYNFYNATATNRFKITSTGIACFACQVCVKERVWVSGTFPGVMLDRSSTTAQSDIQWKDSGTSVWSIGTAVAAVGSNLDFYSYGLGNVLKLAPTGEACFRYVVCAQSGIIPGVGGNLLSTYNESISFTPCLYFQGAVTGLSYATRSGYYSRIGNMVIAQMYIQWCKASSATDNLGVYLPVYTTNNTTPPIGNFYSGNQPSETRAMSVYGSPNSNLAIVLTQGGGGNLSNCFANSTLHYWSITMAYLA